ncbi:MAG: peptidoglycan-binding protein [Armatimonadetes bacterium]|nr:peptidoglycan-binding protein [Armatimonadota bacterium]
MGTAFGVRAGSVSGRVWDCGVLVPWIKYKAGDAPVIDPPSSPVYRLKRPLMRGPQVMAIQRALKRLGFDPGPIDGFYGQLTASAVAVFQAVSGVVTDGQAGPITMALLGV